MNVPAENTVAFRLERDVGRAGDILRRVYAALGEKGYDPAGQIVGYLLSGDPTYITTHRDARRIIRELERNEIMEELVRSYLSASHGK